MERLEAIKTITSSDAFIRGVGSIIPKRDQYLPDLMEITLTHMARTVGFKGLPREVTGISLNSVGIDLTINRTEPEVNAVALEARQTWDLLQIDTYAQQKAQELGMKREPLVRTK